MKKTKTDLTNEKSKGKTKKITRKKSITSKVSAAKLSTIAKGKKKSETTKNKPRRYKEPNKSETETTVNVLYWKKVISIYTNKVDLQKQLRKALGKPTKEDMRGKSIVATRWDIPISEKQKISQMILKANIFEL